MDEEIAFAEALKKSRIDACCQYVRELPTCPPSVVKVWIKFQYDDGNTAEMELSPAR